MSSSEEETQTQEDDVFILNVLDEENPFDGKTWELLREYVMSFFGIPIKCWQTPKTPVSPAG